MARLVFDFDGTLADSLTVALEVVNSMEFTRPLTLDDYYALRNLPTRLILKDLGVPVWKVPKLAARGKQLLNKQAHRLTPYPGIQTLITQLHKDGHQLSIVSSNSPEIVHNFLERYKLEKYFESVTGNVGVFGKTAILKKLRKQFESDETAYYIGDETRDIDAARKSGLQMIAVGWGYNGVEVLRKRMPEYLVMKPQEIRDIAKGNG